MIYVLAILAALAVILVVVRFAIVLAERKAAKRQVTGAAALDYNEGAASAVAPDGSVDFGGGD